MNDEERGTEEGEKRGPAKEGGLGILFLGATVGLAMILSLVGLLAYYAMKR
jgi:hypothetical protein